MSKYEQYCCIKLLDACEDGWLAQASGGVWLTKEGDGCLSGNPSLKYCPFCAATIVTVHNENGTWDWYTEASDSQRAKQEAGRTTDLSDSKPEAAKELE